ncbi:albusnodin/ikarugamycin family macrolactam cyclase [Actinorugispora endophytica]|uniref:Asparagine synthase (Glutamine-hydrolysing) n=1 Tax=Actinorugispora endophytica TaxID=1605990 RepID=A0A4R6UF03_9ACTN|nr:albusnodin/ikarugamycin family macrolactam cyclase [Actinorugispora endophytica]TDQ45390.1 asparagine synthase (glutamine-hydrolysing) [Actinorugispora endophytica]
MWFGGSGGPRAGWRRPVSSRPVWPDSAGFWDSGDWPRHERKTVERGGVRVAVFGPCGVSRNELEALAASDAPDDMAWRWPGSYTVVRLDHEGTTIWTDLGWAQPVYILTTRGVTTWASSSLLLASLNGHRPDLSQITDRLIDPDLSESAARRSWFAGVERLPPGHRVTLARDGTVGVGRVWVPRHKHGLDHPALLRTELDAAVRLRVDTADAPSTDFSGGFDSTALGLIAAEHLYPRRRRIIASTVHPSGVTSGGDLDYAREAGWHPGLHHVWLPLGDEHAPYQELDRVPATDEPAPTTVSHAYFSAQLHWLAREHGCDLHMTGDGGDGLLLTQVGYLADLARAGKAVRAVRETALWAHVRKKSWFDVLGSIRKSSSPQEGRPWVNKVAREQEAPVAELFEPCTRSQRSVISAVLPAGRTARSDAQIAERCGIGLHNPYFDSRIIDTCLAVPTRELPGPARYKPLMAEAMAGLFPPRLARRTTKGDASADHYGGLRKALPRITDMLDGHLAALGLIDVPRLRRVVADTAAGLSSDLYPVESAVAVETWLRALTARPTTTWLIERTEART